VKLTENKVKINKEEKKKKKEKRKRTDKNQQTIESIALTAEQIPLVVNNNVITFKDGEEPPDVIFIENKKYKLRKKANVKYESEDEDENKVKKEEEEFVNQSEGENEVLNKDENEERDGEADDETDEANKKKKTKTLDPNSRKGQVSLNVRRHREERNMRMLKYFGIDYDKDEYLKHGKYYRSMNKYLKEKPQGSGINRIEMYEAEKRRNGVSPVAREVTRKRGPKTEEPIVVDDDDDYNLRPRIISKSIDMKAMEREQEEKEQTEEELAEKTLAFYMKKAKQETERQKTYTHSERNPPVDKKKEFATKVLNYLAINKGEPSDPKKWTHRRKDGKQITIDNDDVVEVESLSSDVDPEDYSKPYTGQRRKKKDKRKFPLTENDEELYPNVMSLIEL
jgi:hypothetical protein